MKATNDKTRELIEQVDQNQLSVDMVSVEVTNAKASMETYLTNTKVNLKAIMTVKETELNRLSSELKASLVSGAGGGGSTFYQDGVKMSKLIDAKETSVHKLTEELCVGDLLPWRKNLDTHIENFPEFKWVLQVSGQNPQARQRDLHLRCARIGREGE